MNKHTAEDCIDNKVEALTPRDIQIAGLRAAGLNYRAIGQEVGVSRQTVCTTLKDDCVRDIVESCRQRFALEGFEKAVTNILNLIKDYESPVLPDKDGKLTGDQYQRKEHGYRASMKALESLGIVPAHTPTFLQNVFNVNQSNHINPIVDKILTIHLSSDLMMEEPQEEK